jgi:spermidine synthase
MQLLATYAGRYEDLKPWLRDAEINYDSNLRLQYMAGLALNVQREGSIYSEMLAYRRFPQAVFTGSEDNVRALHSVLNVQ